MIPGLPLQTARFTERVKRLFSLKGGDASAIRLADVVQPTILLENPSAPELAYLGNVRPWWAYATLGAGGAGVMNFLQVWNGSSRQVVVVERIVASVPTNSLITLGVSDTAYTSVAAAVVRDTRIAPPSVVWGARAGILTEIRSRANAVALNYTEGYGANILANTAWQVEVNAVIGPQKAFVVANATANVALTVGFMGYERDLEPSEPL